jgi:hypothetical protein
MSDKEAMVRWQGYAREQRSEVNSLFLTYAAALIGIEAATLMSKDVAHVAHSWPFLAAGAAALLSVAVGCAASLLRLRDARLTARIARYRDEGRGAPDIMPLQISTRSLGKWTNRFLAVQVIVFAVAAVAFVVWVVLAFGAKLGGTPNQSMEPTASRRTIQLCMRSSLQFAAARVPARGSSSCSR